MKIERREIKTEYQTHIELLPPGRVIGVTVDKYHDDPWVKEPRINWPAIGAVNIAKAEQMIELLQEAVKEAKKL